MKKLNFKKLKFSVNNTVTIIFTVVFVLLINTFTSVLETKVPNLKLDLTMNAVTKISDETKSVLKKVDEGNVEIEIIYLKGTGDERSKVTDVLEQYDAYSENISYKSVNYHTNPKFLESYGINSDANVDGSVLVARKDKSKARIVTEASMEMSYNNRTVFALESLLTNAVGVVASEKQMKVCFTTGHGESVETVQKNPVTGAEEQGAGMLINLLKSENIMAYQFDLATGQVPEEIDLVVVLAPQKDFTLSEINALDNYMLSGGDVVVALPGTKSLNRLEEYVLSWGLKVNNDIVAETEAASKFDEEGIYFYPKKSDYWAVNDISNRILASYARSMEYAKTGDIEANVLLSSSDNAYKMELTDSGINSSNVKTGRADIAYILEKPLDGSFEKTAKLIVTTTPSVWGVTDALINNYDAMVYYSLAEGSFGNIDFVMNMLSDVFGETIQSIYVPVKSSQISILTITDAQAAVLKRVMCVVVPFVVLLLGVVVWLKRRNK